MYSWICFLTIYNQSNATSVSFLKSFWLWCPDISVSNPNFGLRLVRCCSCYCQEAWRLHSITISLWWQQSSQQISYFLWRAAGKFPFSLCMIKVIFTEAEYPWILQVSFELIIFMIPRYLWSMSKLNQVHIAVYVFTKRILEKIYELFEIYPLEGLIQKDQFPFFCSDHCCEYTEHVTRLITDKNQQRFKGTYTFDCNSFQECHLRIAKQIC